jgi:multiple sugar transport system permease protein
MLKIASARLPRRDSTLGLLEGSDQVGLMAETEAGSAAFARSAEESDEVQATPRDWTAAVLLAPAIVYMTVVGFYPLVYSAYISFTDYNPVQGRQGAWIGLDNFTAALSDGQFWHALFLTAIFTVLSVGLSLCLAVLLALLFNKQLPGFVVLRTIVLVPMLVTPIAVGIIWRTMMNPDRGLLNFLLSFLGIDPQPWVGSSASAFASILLVDVWEWTPFLFIIILAGLRGLPASPFEAAAIDGAGAFRVFFNLTLPMLKPVIIIATLLRIVDAARTYDAVFILTRGGPDFATDLGSIYLQRVNFQFFNLGYGSALSWIFLLAVLAVVLVFVKWSGFLRIVSDKEPA